MEKEIVAKFAKAAYDKAYLYEGTIKGCAQCVLMALEETIGGIGLDVIRAASGFAGGVSRTGNLCGAFSGGVMAIGCYAGRKYENREDPDGIVSMYPIVDKLTEKFVNTYEGCNCPQVHKKLIGRVFDFKDPKERELFAAAGAYVDKCTSACGNGAKWVVEILAEEGLIDYDPDKRVIIRNSSSKVSV